MIHLVLYKITQINVSRYGADNFMKYYYRSFYKLKKRFICICVFCTSLKLIIENIKQKVI